MFRGALAVLLLRLGAVAVVYTVLRVLFWLLNTGTFPDPPAASFLAGVRFDLFAIVYLNLPWVLLYLVHPKPGKSFARVQLWVFITLNAIGLFFNCVDLEYYKFSLKRSTADFLDILTQGGDTANLMPAFVRDYWYIVLIYLGCLALLVWSYKRIGRLLPDERPKLAWRIGWRVIAVILLVIASRGGLQLMPLQVLDGARYGGATYLPVVLNTPYTIMMSLGKPTLEERTYMEQAEADALWPVVHEFVTLSPSKGDSTDGGLGPPNHGSAEVMVRRAHHDNVPAHHDKMNVVVIILESFSAIYSAELAGGQGYMPFLDSLMRQGLCFTRAYANGRRSIDGIPAILASMPELMNEAFITSPYASQPFTSLANVLAADGYRTSFYHGGRNGTMGFDGFARSAGFQRYVGLNEYTGPDTDNDGHWGVRDEPFLQFYADELTKEPQPFMSTVFTLSSHHPYELPPADAQRFAGGTQAIHPTLRYADHALRRFFTTARTMPWFANTLFVITADHTADLERTGKHSDKAIDYWVPLVFYAPGMLLPHQEPRVTQHIDIVPTVLDLIGYTTPFFSFGQSAVRPDVLPYAVMSSNGVYNIVGDRLQVQFDGTQVIGAVPLDGTGTPDPVLAAEMELRLKAAVQQFNHHLLHNSLVARPDVP